MKRPVTGLVTENDVKAFYANVTLNSESEVVTCPAQISLNPNTPAVGHIKTRLRKQKINPVNIEPYLENGRITSKIKRLRSIWATVMVMIFFITGTWATHDISKSVTITHFNQTVAIFYENVGNLHLINDEWKIIVYIDLKNYWSQLENLQKHVSNMEWTCTHHAFPEYDNMCTKFD